MRKVSRLSNDFPERNNRFKTVKNHDMMYMYTRVNTRFHLA